MTRKETEELNEIGRTIQKQDWWSNQRWITTREDIKMREKLNMKTDNLVAIEDIWFKIGNGKMNLKTLKNRESKQSLKEEITRLKEDKKYLIKKLISEKSLQKKR